jgi:hypothetical protein
MKLIAFSALAHEDRGKHKSVPSVKTVSARCA